MDLSMVVAYLQLEHRCLFLVRVLAVKWLVHRYHWNPPRFGKRTFFVLIDCKSQIKIKIKITISMCNSSGLLILFIINSMLFINYSGYIEYWLYGFNFPFWIGKTEKCQWFDVEFIERAQSTLLYAHRLSHLFFIIELSKCGGAVHYCMLIFVWCDSMHEQWFRVIIDEYACVMWLGFQKN